ncbi:hypothetical protein [Rhizobium sp. SG2393]|uniref:hypothetical protein n=1 Tax=Rhizobium sp. SG2393 TaxID=3276279 RepID=UPI00366A5B70
MFHFGGMTMGYLAAAETTSGTDTLRAAETKTVGSERPSFFQSLFGKRSDERSEREREEEMARAFLTPWHLFY